MPGIKPKEKVKRDWSPELAYAIGLLATDGSLSKDGRHINFTSKEIELIQTFKKCLGLKNAVGRKTSGFTKRRDCYQVQFGDVVFCRWLLELGFSPNKSKTIGALAIPNDYFFDFLRGCFDGDGSINAYWDPRWHSSYMYYLRFSSGSVKHLQWLHETVSRLSNIAGRVKRNGRCYELVFAKKGTFALFQKMFYDKNIPCLKRKCSKAREIFRIDREHDTCPGGGTW